MKNILLVEDNEGDVEITKMAFKAMNVNSELHIAYDGEEALDFLKKTGEFENAPTPDLILLDINMPRMDGKEFLSVVKTDPKFRAIPVIMLTSSDNERDIKDCYDRYANSYVLKSFDMREALRNIINFWKDTAVIAPHQTA